MADSVCHVKAVQYQLQPAVGYCPAAVWKSTEPPEVYKSRYRATACATAGVLREALARIYLRPGNVLHTHKAEISVNRLPNDYNDAGRIHDTIYHYSTPIHILFPEYFGATADAAVLCSLLFRTVP